MERTINDDGMYKFFQDLVDKEGTTKSRLEPLLGAPDESLDSSSLSDTKIKQLYATLRANYSENETKEQILLIDHADRFLNGYFRIDGLSYLLISNYNEIENNIFYEIEAKKGRQKMIREHFRHQFRNAYLACVFMLDFNLLDDMAECVRLSRSPICEYIKKTARAPREGVYPGKLTTPQDGDYLHRLKQIIFKSVFIASLFHDIGYPLAYFFRNVRQIQEFTPFVKIVSPNVKATYAELKSLLNASVLFRYVEDGDIRAKYEQDDHGVLSALGFLVHFYGSGRIHTLDAGDKCVIELAANAIYHHTDRGDRSPLIFEYDPISFVVRLCDDLQEWERFYLLVDNRHNYLKCMDCGKLIKSEDSVYKCDGCGKSYEKITQIKNRKVNYINFCREIHISRETGRTGRNSRIKVEIDYDCYAQLELLMNHYDVIVKRGEDMERLREMLKNQTLLPEITVEDKKLSTNPIVLLENLFAEYECDDEKAQRLIDQKTGKEKENLQKFFREYLEKKKDKEFYGGIIEKQNFIYPKRRKEFLEDNLGGIHTLKRLMEKGKKDE